MQEQPGEGAQGEVSWYGSLQCCLSSYRLTERQLIAEKAAQQSQSRANLQSSVGVPCDTGVPLSYPTACVFRLDECARL